MNLKIQFSICECKPVGFYILRKISVVKCDNSKRDFASLDKRLKNNKLHFIELSKKVESQAIEIDHDSIVQNYPDHETLIIAS